MPLRLRSDMMLEPLPEAGYVLLRKGDPAAAGPRFRLHPLQAVTLALFDGHRERGEVEEVFAGAFGHTADMARRAVGAVHDRYRQFLVPGDGAATNGSAPAATDLAEFLFPTDHDFAAERDGAPAALLWVVTECCGRRCRYCYKDAAFVEDGVAFDLGLSTARVAELVDEAADLGVTSMVLTGGEPFLRPDLGELIAHMVARGLDVIPITKHRLDDDTMATLVRAGLPELHVSLDSHDPGTVDFLTGTPGAFDDMTATLRCAERLGLPVVLRPVLTSYNVRHLADVVDLGHSLGVRRFLADVYGESCGRHEAVFEITEDDWGWLRRQGPAIAERYPDAEFGFKFDKPPLPASQRHVGRGCVEGKRGMTFLPDGRVTKCEHWRFGDELTYGDLSRQSILEVWAGPAIRELLEPGRQDFAGTICHRCNRFEACNQKRGRCVLSSLTEHGTLGAPDVYCPIGAFQRPVEKGGNDAQTA